nr:retrotransposon protein, putative, Ty1-copia subclass [Tanacetum cinerariifolium]
MASSMSPESQKTFKNTWDYKMNQKLKEMFQAKASKECLDVVKSLMACKLKPRASICAFVLEMKGYFKRLEYLNMVFDTELSINIILSGKATQGKSDHGSKRKFESEIAPISDPKEAMCFYYNTKGHWKRSCPKYLKDLKDENVEKGGYSGKMTISPLTGTCEKGEGLLDLVHTDIKLKSDTFEVFKRYQNEVENQLGRKIKDNISDSTLNELNEPANYKEAMVSPEAAKWKEAKKSEIQSMYDNQVWNLVDTTPSLKMVGCKWIFKKKTNMDGKIHTYKARLVMKGYTQTHKINYDETFSPVAKIKSIRIMLVIAAFLDYEIWKMDVKTAFVNEKLIEDVFMAQSKGFENEKYPKRVCKLQKAIYGLKQASRSWNLCFHEKVTQFRFSRSEDESCVYVKVNGSVVVFLVFYVDDILLIGNDILMLQSVKVWLGKCFTMKDLGDAVYILDDELEKIGRVPYASAIGSIMYAMMCIRPDVSFALSMVSRHQQKLGAVTWKSSKQDTVVDSMCESEYIVACEASKKLSG